MLSLFKLFSSFWYVCKLCVHACLQALPAFAGCVTVFSCAFFLVSGGSVFASYVYISLHHAVWATLRCLHPPYSHTGCLVIRHLPNVTISQIISFHSTKKNDCMLNWWKGKPSGSIACTTKQQPRFYWSCSSAVMNDATPLTPPSA